MSLAPESYRPGPTSARLDVTATSGSVALPSGGGTLEVVNFSVTDIVWISAGVGATTAAIPATGAAGAGWAVPPGATKRIRINPLADTLAAICLATKTATIAISRGDGI